MSNQINESRMVSIQGINQYILIRGKNINNPFLLLLHGGPGSPLSPIASLFPKAIEEQFNLVFWDQRGAGKSYSDDIPLESMNLEQLY